MKTAIMTKYELTRKQFYPRRWKEEEGGERLKRKIVAGRDTRRTNDRSLSIVGIKHHPWDLREIDTAVERDDSARHCELFF